MNYLTCVPLLMISVILLSDPSRVHGHIQYSRYELPSLYTFDDYDLCFQKNTTELSTTYCMVYAEIKSDDSSELWQKIKAHSEASKFHYRHDRLFFGLCLDRCKQYAQSASRFDLDSFTKDNLISNEITDYFERVHKRPLDLEMRAKYSEPIHTCLNTEFEKRYNLTLRIFIEYCEGRTENEQQIAFANEGNPKVITNVKVAVISGFR